MKEALEEEWKEASKETGRNSRKKKESIEEST